MNDKIERRYDIDWLRVIAIGFLLIYHIGIGFQPWGVFIQFIQIDKPLEILWIPMSLMNVWRIPLLFFVSGMGVGFAIRKRNWKQLILERTQRILIPFLFGLFFIVPVHIFLWQDYYNQDLSYTIHPVHLWFLGNIFIYVIVLSPLFFYLKNNEDSRLIRLLKRVYGHPAGLLFITLFFILEVSVLAPESFETYAMNLHGFTLGFLAFFFGFSFVLTGNKFWVTASRWRWIYLAAALTLYLVRLLVFELKAPGYLIAIESNTWIFGILGLGYRYLNHSGKTLNYLSQAAYPVYILHMIFLYLGSYLIFPLDVSSWSRLGMVISFTFSGCFLTYEFIIRRLFFLRPFFGLKTVRKKFKEEQEPEFKKNSKIYLSKYQFFP